MPKRLYKKIFIKIYPYTSIILLAFLIYANSLSVPFTLDDFSSIQDNYAIRNPLDFKAIWDFYSNRFVLYYTLSLNYYIHNTYFWGYHVVNIIIHSINGILVYLILYYLLGLKYFKDNLAGKHKQVVSLLAAFIFTAHPVHVNAVTYIIQRTASLAAMFYMLAMLFFILYRIKNRVLYFVLTMLFTVIAMFTKENTITLPFILALIEFMFFLKDGRTSWKKRILFLLIIFTTVPIIPGTNLLLSGYSQSDPNVAFKASTDMNRFHYFYTELNVIVKYIKLMFIPDNLNFDYSNDFPISKTIWENHSYISFLILSIIGIAGVLNFRRNKLIALGIFWFFIGLAVESSFISIKDVYFEHRLYFPAAGFVIFVTGFVFDRHGRKEKMYFFKNPITYFFVLSIVMTVVYSAVTIHRNYIFSNPIRLWSDVVKKAPGSDRGHSVLATEHLNAYEFGGEDPKHLDIAEVEFKKAISINYYNDTAHCNLAKVYLLKNDYNNCIKEAKKANDIEKSIYAYNNLGLGYKNQNKLSLALDAFSEGYKLDSKSSFILENLANTYYDMGSLYNAKTYYKEYLDNYYSEDIENKLKEVEEKINSLQNYIDNSNLEEEAEEEDTY